METLTKTFGNSLKMIIEKNEIKQSDLANICGINKSSLSRVVQNNSESDFESVLALVRYLVNLDSELQEDHLMQSYIREIVTSSNLKTAMEYCDTHDMREMLEILCKRADDRANRKNNLNEFSNMYRINRERKTQQAEKHVSKDLFNKIIYQNNKTKEMQKFQLILELESYHQERNFYKVLDLLPALRTRLAQTENSLQKSLKMRLIKLEQTIYLRYVCDFSKTRELAFEALENSIGKRFDAASYVNLGDSHIHDEDPTRAIGYLEKSIDIYNDIGLGFVAEWMRSKVEFISLLRGRKIDCIKTDRNIALDHIMNGKKEKGLKVLDELDITPDTLYMKGIATEDPSYFWQSLDGFLKRGDRLYGLFAVQELQRLGERQEAIDAVYNNEEEVKQA